MENSPTINSPKVDSPTKLEKTVIDNIRKIRREKGMSQMRLSIFCGTSASYIGLMETYKNIPKLSTIERIAEALDVSVLDLFKSNVNDATKSSKEKIKAESKKRKIRSRLKKEILSKMSEDLDEILQLI